MGVDVSRQPPSGTAGSNLASNFRSGSSVTVPSNRITMAAKDTKDVEAGEGPDLWLAAVS